MELTRRDKYVLAGGTIFLVLFCLVQFVCLPAVDRLGQLEQIRQARVKTTAQMKTLAQDCQANTHRFDRQIEILENRPPDFTLFSFLDAQARLSGVKKNVVFMQPGSRETDSGIYRLMKVKVKLKGVFSKGLIDFLSRIESSPHGVQIVSLSLVKSGQKGNLLDAVFEARTLGLREADRK